MFLFFFFWSYKNTHVSYKQRWEAKESCGSLSKTGLMSVLQLHHFFLVHFWFSLVHIHCRWCWYLQNSLSCNHLHLTHTSDLIIWTLCFPYFCYLKTFFEQKWISSHFSANTSKNLPGESRYVGNESSVETTAFYHHNN